ncbi:hypothetical protein R1flu_005357 [Riccia fluitans]|uniref:Uncharacterized protein n=1 Tax=Riccia fluitans TaxID=41844 RepID=A0ABD1YTL3_9MARC
MNMSASADLQSTRTQLRVAAPCDRSGYEANQQRDEQCCKEERVCRAGILPRGIMDLRLRMPVPMSSTWLQFLPILRETISEGLL